MLAIRKRSRRGQATSRNPERTRELLLQAAFQEISRSGLREGQKRGVVRSDINANETATFLIAADEGYTPF